MGMKVIQTAIIAYLSLQGVSAVANVICYYESWGAYAPEDIDINICTHVNYAFLGINGDGSLRMDGGDDILRRVGQLKNNNPNLKVLVSVGGWSEGSEGFSQVAANAGAKQNMADSTMYYIENYNLDGIDIDWEYPGQRGGTPADKENFIDMLWVIRNTIGTDRLITIAASSIPEEGSYNVGAISKVVDFINVMTYDFHGSYDGKTGQNSPLYAQDSDSDWERQFANCDASISNWINAGADPGKTVLGLAFYGHTFQLSDPGQNWIGAPCSGDGMEGGYMDYSAICTMHDGWTEVFDETSRNPYKYAGDQWVGYDNPQSIGEKVQYANNRGLGGVMMWAVDGDDKNGNCGPRNGLLQAIADNK